MITLLDTVGPAVWRASWQAAALALVVLLLMRSFGERISPRWRFLLLSVVVLRLLFVVTPASPWSAFNLVRLIPEASAREGPCCMRLARRRCQMSRAAERDVAHYVGPKANGARIAAHGRGGRELRQWRQRRAPAISPLIPARKRCGTHAIHRSCGAQSLSLERILSLVWLAGCFLFGVRLLGAYIVLRRRLSVCRPVRMPPFCRRWKPPVSGSGCERAPTCW